MTGHKTTKNSTSPKSPPARGAEELKVFISTRESACDECKEQLGRRAWITLNREKGALCLSCGDLDHLVFLASGDPALTRRARKYSGLSAVVLKWSTARKRYERQGLLVEEAGLAKAEDECLADGEARARRSERAGEKRREQDRDYVARFAARVRELFSACPKGREKTIAEHACLKYSGRVGRSAPAKALDEQAVLAAVRAHVRHVETSYDELLLDGVDRREARAKVRDEVEQVLGRWRE